MILTWASPVQAQHKLYLSPLLMELDLAPGAKKAHPHGVFDNCMGMLAENPRQQRIFDKRRSGAPAHSSRMTVSSAFSTIRARCIKPGARPRVCSSARCQPTAASGSAQNYQPNGQH